MPIAKVPSIGDKEHHKLLGLDHLRAFAILYVILFHYQFFGHPAWVKTIAGFGWSGVDLFFVLSGFLISGQLFGTIAKGKQISLSEFFIKRFFRIIPPFLFVVILYASFPALREWGHLSPIWRYLTFTLNFGLDLRRYGTFSHAWSLCVEEQFYFFLPLLFVLFSYFKIGSKAIYLLVALFIGGFIIRFWSWNHFIEPVLSTDNYGACWNEYIYYPTYNRLDSLLVGVSIAGLYTFYPSVKAMVNKYCNLVMLFGIILWVISYLVCRGYSTYNTTMWGFPLIAVSYGLILAAVVCPASPVYRFKSYVTAQIATLSYSMYLTHKIVIHVVQNLIEKAGMDKNSNLTMLICLVGIIAGALLSRYLIEKPAMYARDRLLKSDIRSQKSEERVPIKI
ncbi:acyltransferase family protein [Mucilaginibacter sp. McL0603]|uniref:acyltransferase family protein n=1 Tax=Mucilaginibacter sp. McL0603 TaxID=3415670 RepID=UPI003CF54115